MGKRRVNFQRCWLPVSRIGLHRRGVERVNCGPKLLDLGEKGVYSSYTCRVPGGDYEGYVDAHVRRLEALRRAGIVERIDADQWRIPDDLVSRAAAHDAGRDSQASVRVLSPVDLNKQIGSDGATWLDRRLIHGETADLAPTGFGQQVREAMDQRREHHIEQGDATRRRCVPGTSGSKVHAATKILMITSFPKRTLTNSHRRCHFPYLLIIMSTLPAV